MNFSQNWAQLNMVELKKQNLFKVSTEPEVFTGLGKITIWGIAFIGFSYSIYLLFNLPEIGLATDWVLDKITQGLYRL